MVYNGTAVFGPVTVNCVASATRVSMTDVSITPSHLIAGNVVKVTVTPRVLLISPSHYTYNRRTVLRLGGLVKGQSNLCS